jgi:hypothetical protein
MNSKSLIDDRRQIPVYNVDPSQGKNPRQQRIQCVPRKDFEDLDAERRRLRQALIDRGVNPNDIPAVPNSPPPPTGTFLKRDRTGDGLDQGILEMPKYRCHKVVWALKINTIEVVDSHGRRRLHFEDVRYAAVSKDHAWVVNTNAEPGGYYVVYADGYSSFSPAKAFEEGYTRIDGELG